MAAAPPPPAISGMASLSGAALDLLALREASKNELIDILLNIRGPKGLVIDPSVIGPLGLVIDVASLKAHGVENIFPLLPGRLDAKQSNIVYLVRPEIHHMKAIADHIHNFTAERANKDFYVYFIPRQTLVCEKVLQEEGVQGDVNMGEFNLDLISFDDDLLSLELASSFKDCFLDGDRTALFYVANSIMKLQRTFGIIPHVMGAGPAARDVADMMFRMRQENLAEDPTIPPEIERIIIIDRSIDYVTPMCTQLTYEGLIDEFLGINNAYVDLDPEIAGVEGKSAKKVKHPLNSNDKLYAEIRDLNFATLGPLLNAKAQYINQGYEERHQAATVAEIKIFVDKFKGLQQEHKSLTIHTSLAESIMKLTRKGDFMKRIACEQNTVGGVDTAEVIEYLEDCIDRQVPLNEILRLMCLVSVTANGLKPKVYDFLRREIVQSYGFQHMFTLHNLEKLGLLRRNDGKSSFTGVRKGLRLVVDDVNEAQPDDISYTFSGYAPLTVRLVEYATRPGWASLGSILGLLPQPFFDETQTLPPGVVHNMASGGATATKKTPVTLVYFVGGVTFAEIAAIRFLGQNHSGEDVTTPDYVIATTKLINGNSLLQSVTATLENNLVRA